MNYQILGESSKRLQRIWRKLGPGFITGASDDDPSGIATYSQAGAQFGLSTLWTAFLTYPLMWGIQEMCARIGIVSEHGLTTIIKKYYSRFILFSILTLLAPAILFNIAANLAGMTAVAHLLIPSISPIFFSLAFLSLLTLALIFYSYKKFATSLKWLCLSLLVYLLVPFSIEQNWKEITLATILPTVKWNKEFFMILLAILGTTISPYLFFWQTSMSLESKLHNPDLSLEKHIQDMRIDVNIGMFLSNIVMFFIILTTGSVLFPQGMTHIATVKEAAEALKPLAGNLAYLLFALGIIGTGFLALPILAACLGYIFGEAFNWERGIDKRPKEAKRFYLILIGALWIGFAINSFGIDPIKSLIYTALFYGMAAPILIGLLLHICNNPKIMGPFTNTRFSNILGGLALLLMSGSFFFFLFI